MCCFWSTVLVFCVCAHLCVNVMFVCFQACLPACLCAFSLKVTFVCSVCFSFVYQPILCLRAEKQQYAKALSCLISLSARLFHHPSHYRPAQRDGPWLQHSESCVELSLQRCSSTFFATTPLLFSYWVNVQPLGPILQFFSDINVFNLRGCHLV